MHIVYAVTTCSDAVYKQLFENSDIKPVYQAQKYHRLLIEGLAKHAKVDVVANPPVVKQAMNTAVVTFAEETEGGAVYHHIAAVRNPIRKLIHVAVAMFGKTFQLARKDSVVIVDCLNRTAAFSAMIAAKLRGSQCVCIITDLPDMLGGNALYLKMADYVIKNSDAYVLLTQAMNDYIKNPGKPYVILEGHADIQMAEKIPSMEKKGEKRICMYAGRIFRQYGLENLVQGFRMAKIPNAQLVVYGDGDYVPELERIAAEDPSVVYGGLLLSSQVVEKEMEATLLVNPRPTNEEYVKYSFPSKTMEYMSTGTPVLTTVLPGLPKEYYPHVFFIRDETPEGIASALQEVFANSDEELFARGMQARNFVLSERNNVVQAGKIIAMLEKERAEKR